MASKNQNLIRIFGELSPKSPMIYISFLFACGVYFLIFHVLKHDEAHGVIERTTGTKVFFVFFVTVFLYATVSGSTILPKVDSRFVRFIVLIGFTLMSTIFILPAWMINEYDNEKMNTYLRVLPFDHSPRIQFRETLYYRDIETVESKSGGGDSGGSFVIRMKNGSKQSIPSGSVSRESMSLFLINLYQECSWLRNDIEKEYGSLEKRIIELENSSIRVNPNYLQVFFSIITIWITLLMFGGIFKKI